MGTYYKLVNITKKEIFEPEFVKRSNYVNLGSDIADLLLGDWLGDEVMMTHDGDFESRQGKLYSKAGMWPNRWKP